MNTVKISAERDAEAKRYVARCPLCTYRVERAKKDAALHNLSMHVTYQHDAEVDRDPA